MSATLRHDLGLAAWEALHGVYPDLAAALGARDVTRWRGLSRTRPPGMSFAVALPVQVALVMELRLACGRLRDHAASGLARNSFRALWDKLSRTLGLTGSHPGQAGFWHALEENPGDLTSWRVYADWLMEQGDPQGELIQGWLDPKKALKVRYGVPVLVREWRKDP